MITMLPRGAFSALIGLVFAALCALPVHGQSAAGSPGTAAATSTLRIKAKQLGLGGRARAGEWFGLQVSVSGTTSPRDVLVRMGIPDSDGDTAEFQSQVTLTPGTEQNVWLYGRLPANPPATLTVSVFDLEATAAGARKLVGLAGSTEIPLNPGTSTLSPWMGAIGMVGRATMGLELYTVRQNTYECLPTGHEGTDLISGLQTSDLPDRWMGYGTVSTLVWGTSDATARPGNLSGPQAAALKDWIGRGGHLVVVLPTIATDWFGPTNPLAPLLPAVSVDRTEKADLGPIAALIGGKARDESIKSTPRTASVNFFKHDAVSPSEACLILTDHEGRGIVARRLLGAGMVTLIGLDLASPAVLATGGVQTDVFWNRVLGRRGELKSGEELARLKNERKGFFDQRQVVTMDSFVSQQINKTGAAAIGVVLALVVFGAYWAIAGPLGFFLLKRGGRTHLAWLGYLSVAAVFTGVAWGGATLIKPQKVEVTHLTVLDAVHGQGVQRARMWASLLLPEYGSTAVSIAEDPDRRNLVTAVTPWEPVGTSTSGGFPDARGYAIDSRLPDRADFPSRSTIKPVRVDWAGSVNWKLPIPLGESPSPGVPPRLKVVERKAIDTGATIPGIEGRLKNELRSDLSDVLIIVNRTQQAASASASARLLFRGEAFIVKNWKQGEELDFAEVTKPPKQSGGLRSTEAYFDQISPVASRLGLEGSIREDEVPDRIAAMSFFSCLQPPSWQTMETDPLYRRDNFHGMDLSGYLTQPCVIIIGHMGSRSTKQDSPVPLLIDGKSAPSFGRTVFRWVYPLQESPPRVEAPASEPGAPPQP